VAAHSGARAHVFSQATSADAVCKCAHENVRARRKFDDESSASIRIHPLQAHALFDQVRTQPSFRPGSIAAVVRPPTPRPLPNPQGLAPETASLYEATTTFRTGGHTLTFGGFYAEWQNLIELQLVKAQAPAVSRFENVSDVKNRASTAPGGSAAAGTAGRGAATTVCPAPAGANPEAGAGGS
jgi:hypothetical protein